MKPPHVLCVVGPVGGGKTIATKILREVYRYRQINSGEVMANLLGVPPIPGTSREAFQKMAWDFISGPSGPDRLAEALSRAVREIRDSRIVIDGLRQERTLQCLRDHLSDCRLALLFVQTPPDAAYRFYSQRIAHGATVADFLAVRSAAVESEVEHLIGRADAILYNWTGTLQYRDTIIEMMSALGVQRDAEGER